MLPDITNWYKFVVVHRLNQVSVSLLFLIYNLSHTLVSVYTTLVEKLVHVFPSALVSASI